jgi:UDP-N-acetylmuramate: L-alanyl-gamma-D-glutamyl-meso-diaminopimelate ligase
LINLVPRRGKVIAFDASANVDECVARALCAVERYGFSEAAKWRLTAYRQQADLATWTVLHDGESWAEFTMPLAGEHNALNATAAAALAFGQGIRLDSIKQALRTFRSVKRRLEVRAEIGGVTFIDDFAHHPTAIRETLRALRSRYADRRLIAVLEPRSNTLRRNVFEEELVDSLRLADEVVLAEVFQAANIPAPQLLHPENVISHLRERGTPARLMRDADEIARILTPDLRQGDVVAILSNGGFGNIYDKLPNAFRRQLAASERTEALA